MNRISAAMVFLLAASLSAFGTGTEMSMPGAKTPAAPVMTKGYRIELAGSPQPSGKGKNIVSVRLTKDGKPVVGAIVIQSNADMSPIGMAAMTAPVTALGERPAGTYHFEVANGSVWKKAESWSFSIDAKVQGEPQTVHGSVIVKLAP